MASVRHSLGYLILQRNFRKFRANSYYWQVRKILTADMTRTQYDSWCVQNLIHLPDKLAGVLAIFVFRSSLRI